jgi:signal transduction histidine kinase/CheY-like chemotaxis protein
MKNWLLQKKSRIIIAGALITAVPLIALAIFIYFLVSETVENMVIEGNSTLANIAEKRIESGLDYTINIGSLLVTRPLLIRAVRDNNWKVMSGHLNHLVLSHGRLDRVFITTKKGILLSEYPTDSSTLGRDLSDRDWYKGVSRGWTPYVSDFYTRIANPVRNVFVVAVPIKDTRGSVIGILGMQPKKEFIGQLVGLIHLGKGSIYVVDKKATLIYHSGFQPEGLLSYSYDPVANMALQGAEGVNKLIDPANGLETMYAYKHIGMSGWVVVVKQGFFDVMAPLNRLAVMLLIFTALMVAMGGYFSYQASQQFIEIKRLSDNLREDEAVGKAINEMLMLLNKAWTDEAEMCGALLNKLNELGLLDAGALFIVENGSAVPCSSFLVSIPESADELTVECIKKQRVITVHNVYPDNYLAVDTSIAGRIIPKEVMATPLVLMGEVIGVIEIAGIIGFGGSCARIIEHISRPIAIKLKAIRDSRKMREMSEEIACSNEELRVTNEEMQVVNEEMQAQQAELVEANRCIADASRAKSDFLANMSHELRTPLNSIIGFSEILHDNIAGPLNPTQMEYAGIIRSSGRHLLSLIDDILDLAKIESGKTELSISSFNFRDMLADSLNLFREKAIKHAVSLTLVEDISDEMLIEADIRKVKQILYNLLSNAMKFTLDGGAVTLSAVCVGNGEIVKRFPELSDIKADFVEIAVTDTGIGIKQQDIPKLFKKFSQIESPYEKKYEGTGLGLALSRELVEKHGGRICVESEFGKGSKFAFVLPLTYCPEIEPGLKDRTVSEYKGTRGAVLVIEDNEKAGAIISNVLAGRGYSVITAADGRAGVKQACEKTPDIIILDMLLPGMTGVEVLEQLSGHETASKIPVIALTSIDLSQSARQIFGYQVKETLEKGQVASNVFLDIVDKVYFESIGRHEGHNGA